jgi:hypothetical protein
MLDDPVTRAVVSPRRDASPWCTPSAECRLAPPQPGRGRDRRHHQSRCMPPPPASGALRGGVRRRRAGFVPPVSWSARGRRAATPTSTALRCPSASTGPSRRSPPEWSGRSYRGSCPHRLGAAGVHRPVGNPADLDLLHLFHRPLQIVGPAGEQMSLVVLAIAHVRLARTGDCSRVNGGTSSVPSSRSPMRLLSSRRGAILPAAVLVSETQFSTSSCSNMPVEPKHIR